MTGGPSRYNQTMEFVMYATFGATVEHRFIGPVRLGVWASTSGAAGISIRGDL